MVTACEACFFSYGFFLAASFRDLDLKNMTRGRDNFVARGAPHQFFRQNCEHAGQRSKSPCFGGLPPHPLHNVARALRACPASASPEIQHCGGGSGVEGEERREGRERGSMLGPWARLRNVHGNSGKFIHTSAGSSLIFRCALSPLDAAPCFYTSFLWCESSCLGLRPWSIYLGPSAVLGVSCQSLLGASYHAEVFEISVEEILPDRSDCEVLAGKLLPASISGGLGAHGATQSDPR